MNEWLSNMWVAAAALWPFWLLFGLGFLVWWVMAVIATRHHENNPDCAACAARVSQRKER